MEKKQPIFITGVERSGCALIARILSLTGEVFTGSMTTMYENYRLKQFSQLYIEQETRGLFPEVLQIPINWKNQIESLLYMQGRKIDDLRPWMFKHSSLTSLWPIWKEAYPDARWVIIRRKTPDIINSCMKTTYMTLFKDKEIQKLVGASSPEEGWLWWIHQYENTWKQIIESGVPYKIVWPDRMVLDDYSQIQDLLEWLNIRWSDKIPETIRPLLIKQKKG